MSTITEIETALKELPLEEAQRLAQWLQKYLDQQTATNTSRTSQTSIRLPDYAARRRMILGDKVLPNMVLLGREEERWLTSTLTPASFSPFTSRTPTPPGRTRGGRQIPFPLVSLASIALSSEMR